MKPPGGHGRRATATATCICLLRGAGPRGCKIRRGGLPFGFKTFGFYKQFLHS